MPYAQHAPSSRQMDQLFRLLTMGAALSACLCGRIPANIGQAAGPFPRAATAGGGAGAKIKTPRPASEKSSENRDARSKSREARGPLSSSGLLPVVAASKTSVHLAWLGDKSILYKRSTDGGQSWTKEQVLAKNEAIDNFGIRPNLIADESSVVVAWAEQGRRFRGRTSRDGGVSWSKPWDLGSAASLSLGQGPNGSLYAIHADNRGVWCRESTDHGGRWSKSIGLMNVDTGWTQVATAGGDSRVHVIVWSFGQTSLRREVVYVSGKAGCRACAQPVPLTSPIARDSLLQDVGDPHPAIAVSGPNVVALWSDLPGEDGFSGSQTLFVRSSRDSGATWNPPTRLEGPAGTASLRAKAIAVDRHKVRVVSNLGYWESGDLGRTWSRVRAEWAGESISSSGGATNVVGMERTTTGRSIFHLRLP